jgi:CheY-like chemotaxis protein
MPADRVLGLIDDLMFSSRVDGAVRALGARWQKISSLDDARTSLAEARAEGGRVAVVILDLGWRKGDALAVARELRADPDLSSVPLVAFGSHVQAERLDGARAAGCDMALPNSAFSATLPQILQRYLG